MARKTVTVYVPQGCQHGDTLAYPTPAAAERAAQRDPAWYPQGYQVVPRPFVLPDDALWEGDLITVELHRGGYETDDGIHQGGRWTGPVYGMAHVNVVHLESGRVDGWLGEPGTDRHIQSMPLHAGKQGFPYRNATLVRANDVEAYQ
jgi:hypothetical protein